MSVIDEGEGDSDIYWDTDAIVTGLRDAREAWRSARSRNAEYGAVGFPSRLALEKIVAALCGLRALLDTDVEAAYAGDPAARSVDEVLLCYPCVLAIIRHRLAHLLHGLGARWHRPHPPAFERRHCQRAPLAARCAMIGSRRKAATCV